MPKKPSKELEDLKKTFEEELKRKDELIDNLKKENIVLIRTSLKQSEQTQHWKHYAERLEKKPKQKTLH